MQPATPRASRGPSPSASPPPIPGERRQEGTTLWFERALLADGWASDVRFAFADGVIASIQTGAPPGPGDERHAVAVPGLGNVHSHAFQRAAAGRTGLRGPGGDGFWTWRETIYRLAHAITPETARAIASWAYLEMLESGFTRVGEFHYLHHDRDGRRFGDLAEMALRHLAAAEEVGVDLTLLPVFYAHADVGGAPPRADQARFVCNLETYADLVARCRSGAATVAGAVVGVAPHSLRAVTPDELRAVVALAPAGPIHIHAAEQPAEVARCVEVLGARPVAWLLDHAEVDARWCLVHATHVDADEVRRLAESHAVAGLCPITEADLGDGVFPAAAFAGRSGRWAVGSDSNVRIDAAAELRLLEYGQRLIRGERNVLASAGRSVGRSLFDAAIAGGAQALGGEDPALRAGAPATLVALRADEIDRRGDVADDAFDAWIFASRRPVVDAVWRRGRRVVRDGEHVLRAQLGPAFRAALRELV